MRRALRSLLVADGQGLRFALAESDGTVTLHGRFPEDAPAADEIVVADFGLLERPELFTTAPGRLVGLLLDHDEPILGPALLPAAGAPAPGRPDGGIDFARLAHGWAATPEPLRAYVGAADRSRLDPLLQLRRDARREAKRALDQLHAHVRTTFPAYSALLAPGGVLPLDALAVLRMYPTPAHLRAEGPIRARGVLERTLGLNRRPGVAEFLDFRDHGDDVAQPPAQAEHSVRLVLGALERAELHATQIQQLDRGIHGLVLDGAGGERHAAEPAPAAMDESTSVFDLPARRVAAAAEPATPEELPELFDRLVRLRTRGTGSDRHSRSDLEAYLLLRTAIDAAIDAGAEPTPAQLLERDVVGQILALGASDYHEASRFLAVTRRALADIGADELTARERIDAELVSAITGLVTTNVPTGFGTLRQTLQDARIEEGDPALRSQALGLEMLTLVFYGEAPDHATLVALARAMADAPGAVGAARAGQDIAELLIAGANPATDEARLAELIRLADEHSRDTYYRPFFNFIMMTLSYVTRDHDAAAQNYAELRRIGVWEQHSPPLFAQARLSHAMHLAAVGDFGGARREMAELRTPNVQDGGGTFPLQRELFELYLLAAVGDYAAIRDATEPEGPLGEQNLTRLHGIRYLPAALVLRGTALVRDGATALGHALFRQATATAARFQGWVVLLCGETAEYRAWLEELPADELPEGLPPEARDRIVSRPLFFAHELPALTEQQARVLRLLALGRSTGAIASDLHITANTLKTHLRRLYARLGVGNRKEAVHLAGAYGLLD